MEQTTEQKWAKRVQRWKQSGLTVRESASEQGVRPSSLSWWGWRLGANAAREVTRKRRRGSETKRTAIAKPESTPTVSPLTFIEMSGTLGGEALEVVLASNVRIRVRPEFDVATLTKLLDVLERR